MALENAAIYNDIVEASKVPAESDVWEYLAEVVTPEKTVQAVKVLRYKITRAHSEELSFTSDMITLVITVGRRTYTNDIYPNRDKLSVKVRRIVRSPRGVELPYGETQHRVYKAVMSLPEDLDATSDKRDNSNAQLEEATEQVDVVFQLIEPVMYEMRASTVGGIFRDATVEEVLRSTLGYGLNGKQSLTLLNRDEYLGVRGVDVSAPTNTKRYEQIYVPPWLRIVDVPLFLQRRYGVYSSGIGSYFQDGRWYVYPLRDYTLFTKRRRTLTIVNLPEKEAPALEKSYFPKGEKLFVVTTGKVTAIDRSQETMHSVGNGIRFFRSSDLLDNMATPKNNTLKTRRDETLRQFSITEREDGLNNAEFVPNAFSDNPYTNISPMTKTLGKVMTLQWRRSDYTLIYPGMPVKLLYVSRGELVSLYGTLLGSDTDVVSASEAITEKAFIAMTTLHVFVTPTEL